MRYSIVSNSCVTIRVYEMYNPGIHHSFINYNNPFIGSWLCDDESFIKLCENYDYYVNQKPELNKPPINARWFRDTGKRKHVNKAFDPNYLVMFLDDVEIHWIHETNPDLLLKKYYGRLKISKDYEHIFLWSDAEIFNIYKEEERKNYLQRFNNINKKTIFLTKNRDEQMENNNTVVKFIPEWEKHTQHERNQFFTVTWAEHKTLRGPFKEEIDKFEMKDIILEHIIKEFGTQELPSERTSHYSYCMFPEEECTCKDLNEITYDTSLITGGYIDSFSMVTVLHFLEETFNVKIPNLEATPDNFNTVNKMAELVKRNKK